MNGFLKQQKSSKFGKVIGNCFNISAQMGIPLTLVNTAMLIITTSTALQNRGVGVTVWQMAIAIVSIIGIAALVIWRFVMPNYYAVWSEQFYKHDNPMAKDLQAIKKKLGIEE